MGVQLRSAYATMPTSPIVVVSSGEESEALSIAPTEDKEERAISRSASSVAAPTVIARAVMLVSAVLPALGTIPYIHVVEPELEIPAAEQMQATLSDVDTSCEEVNRSKIL